MLQPVTHSWTRAVPTGLGFNPYAYRRSQAIHTRHALAGLSQGLTTMQLTQQSVGAATAAASAGIAIATASSTVALASGIGAAVAAAIAIGMLIYEAFEGCGQTCTAATSIANKVAVLLGNNLDSYLAQPVHYYSIQQACLNTFNQAWTLLVQNCNNPQLQAAGQNCISQRQQGACAYQTSPGGWQQDSSGNWTYVRPGANGSGTTCWNWFIGYHDPIANDPTVAPDPEGLQVTTNADGSVSVVLPTAAVTVSPSGNVVSSTSTDTDSTASQTVPPVNGTAASASTTSTVGSTGSLMPLLFIGAGIAILLAVAD